VSELGATRPASALRRALRVAVRADARRLFLHDLERALRGEPALPSAPRTLAVICHGNLCRSPFAAALLQRAHPALRVSSFGLAAGAAAGEPAEPRSIELAREWGLDLSVHRTRRLEAADVHGADLLLTMDATQTHTLAQRWPEARARQLSLGDFLLRRPFAIADPWGQPEAVWRDSYGRIALAVDRLSLRLRELGEARSVDATEPRHAHEELGRGR
jgi:protein-tyrosine phosphatase